MIQISGAGLQSFQFLKDGIKVNCDFSDDFEIKVSNIVKEPPTQSAIENVKELIKVLGIICSCNDRKFNWNKDRWMRYEEGNLVIYLDKDFDIFKQLRWLADG